jgi:hypothetical protein
MLVEQSAPLEHYPSTPRVGAVGITGDGLEADGFVEPAGIGVAGSQMQHAEVAGGVGGQSLHEGGCHALAAVRAGDVQPPDAATPDHFPGPNCGAIIRSACSDHPDRH